MLLDKILFILLVSEFIQCLTLNKNYNVILDHLICKSSGTCANPVCKLVTVKRREKLVTLGCNLTEPTYMKILMTYNIKRNGIYRPTILENIELDFCAHASGARLNPFIQLLSSVKSFQTNSSINQKCPYQGFTGIYGLLVDSSVFPDFIPPGLYRVDGKMVHTNGSLMMSSQLFCEVKPKGAF